MADDPKHPAVQITERARPRQLKEGEGEHLARFLSNMAEQGVKSVEIRYGHEAMVPWEYWTEGDKAIISVATQEEASG